MCQVQHKSEVLVLTNYPSPYRIPLYNKVAEGISNVGPYRLTVYFATETTNERQWRVDRSAIAFRVLFGSSSGGARFPGKEFRSYGYSGLFGYLRRKQPALVMVDGFSPGALKTLLAHWLYGQRYAICSEAIDDESDYLRQIRRVERRLISRYAVGGLAMGSLAKRYLVKLGVPRERLSVALNTVDTEFYGAQAVNEARSPGPFRFLSVGSLIPRKGFAELLVAIERLASQRKDFVVDVCGDGPLKNWLAERIRYGGLNDYVQLHGHVQADPLRRRIHQADCFVFPSRRDVWGLVVNEAMAAGLPVLSSLGAGVTHDLVVDGTTGFALDFSDTDQVSQRMAWMIDNPARAERMGQAARAQVFRVASLERSAAAWVDGLALLLNKDGVTNRDGRTLVNGV